MTEPIIDIGDFTTDASGGQYIPNLKATHAVDGNLYSHSSGIITATGFNKTGGATVTRKYANGPAGLLTAMRVQLVRGGTLQYVFLANDSQTFPAGTYTLKIKIKSTSGAGAQQIRFGNYNKGVGALTLASVDESGFTEWSHTFTNGSATVIQPILYVGAADFDSDVIVDEVQLYLGSTTPAYSSEVPDGHLVPALRSGANIVISGGYLDNTAGKKPGNFKLSTWPSKKSFTEGTLVAVINTTNATDTYAKALAASGVTGSWDCGVDTGRAFGKPCFPVTSVLDNATYVANKGTAVLVSRWKNGEQAFFLNGVKIKTAAATMSSSIDAAVFGFMGDPMPDDANLTNYQSYPLQGKCSNARIYDAWLSDSEVRSVTLELAARHATRTGHSLAAYNVWIAEGDSITQGYGSALNTYFKRFFATPPTNWIGTNVATAGARLMSGGALVDLEERLPTTLSMIDSVVNMGHNCFVSVLIGANLLPSISELQWYWGQLRTHGAKVIACTITPNNSSTYWPNFATDRAALNTAIRASSAYYDGLADFAADASIGADGGTSGNPPNATYYQDYVHLNDAGYAIAYGIIQPVLTALATAVPLAGAATGGAIASADLNFGSPGGVLTPVSRYTAKAQARRYTGQA